ncbi:hypothetical protein RRG08_025875 [Elysia crispata]|uniref:Uncharacterized protein n=1 Tax=Elysia crispata TaxID=231223 RepID=A0AAE0ZPN2_9GAST|nr:hypothetical protein RRG08_025875 [Elysia crispata]
MPARSHGHTGPIRAAGREEKSNQQATLDNPSLGFFQFRATSTVTSMMKETDRRRSTPSQTDTGIQQCMSQSSVETINAAPVASMHGSREGAWSSATVCIAQFLTYSLKLQALWSASNTNRSTTRSRSREPSKWQIVCSPRPVISASPGSQACRADCVSGVPYDRSRPRFVCQGFVLSTPLSFSPFIRAAPLK